MTAKSREAICQKLAANKQHLGLPLKDVRRVDEYLEESWGITMPLPPAEWKKAFKKSVGRKQATECWKLHETRTYYAENPGPIPVEVETAYRDLIAHEKLSGLVHSVRGGEILDACCLLVHLVSELGIEGPALEIGCHIGYHAHLLSQETNIEICGTDISSVALDCARAKATSGKLKFLKGGLGGIRTKEPYELIYGVRSVPLEKRALKKMYSLLKPGGVAVIFGAPLPEISRYLNRDVRDIGFGFGLTDVAGGRVGEQRFYDPCPVIVLIKDGSRVIPEDLLEQSESGWIKYFNKYADSPDTPDREKTQAYCRGYLMKGKKSFGGPNSRLSGR